MDLCLTRDPSLQPTVGLLIAQLDDQLRRMHEFLDGWQIQHLEWQAKPGRNTVGMLLAHMAIVELVWMHLACGGSRETREARVRAVLGFGLEVDGMPMEPTERHSNALANVPAEQYLEWLDRARMSTRDIARSWTDADLTRTFDSHGHDFTREWVLYHLVEHFAAHFGQIAALAHAMRDNNAALTAKET
jgi:uncharacterized damage-inducible protein DinB